MLSIQQSYILSEIFVVIFVAALLGVDPRIIIGVSLIVSFSPIMFSLFGRLIRRIDDFSYIHDPTEKEVKKRLV